MPPRRAKTDPKPPRARHGSDRRETSATTVTATAAAATAEDVTEHGYASEAAHPSSNDYSRSYATAYMLYQQQREQQQMQQLQQQQQTSAQAQERYPPYSSYTAFSTDVDEAEPEDTAAAPTARYLLSRPAPLQSMRTNSMTANTQRVPSNTTTAATTDKTTRSSGAYTTTNTKHASPQYHGKPSSAVSPSPSSAGVTSAATGGGYDGLARSVSLPSPIVGSPNALPSVSNASLVYGSFASVPGSPFTPQAAGTAQGQRTSVTARAVPRSRLTSIASGAIHAVPGSNATSSPTFSVQQTRQQHLNDGFVMEDGGELDFNEALAASLASTALSCASFSQSSFSSPLYAAAAGAGGARRPSVLPATTASAPNANRHATVHVPAVTTTAAMAAVYGPSDGVVLQFPQFVDFATGTASMQPLGLEQPLPVDVDVDADVAATATPAADVAAFVYPGAAHNSNNTHPPQVVATTTTTTTTAAAAETVPTALPHSHAMAPNADVAIATAEDTAPHAANAHGGSTPKRPTSASEAFTEDPSPRPHLPPARASATTSTGPTPDQLHRHEPQPHTDARATATAAAAAPTASGAVPRHVPFDTSMSPSSTVAYMREAGEPADAAEVTPIPAPHLVAVNRKQHHTSLFVDDATTTTAATTTATTTPSATTTTTTTTGLQTSGRPYKSSTLSPYSAPWTPATGSILTARDPTAITATSTAAFVPITPLPRSKADLMASATAAAAAASGDHAASQWDDCEVDAVAYEEQYEYGSEVGGLTLSQRRSAQKLRTQPAQPAQTYARRAELEAYSPAESCEQNTPFRHAGVTRGVRTALQQALDEAQADEEEEDVRVVMPATATTTTTAANAAAQQSLAPSLRALLHQVQAQQQQQQQNQKTAGNVHSDPAVLQAQIATPLKTTETESATSKRTPQSRTPENVVAEQGDKKSGNNNRIHNSNTNANVASPFTCRNSPLMYTIAVIGHLNITAEVFSTAPVEKNSYVLYEADRGEDIGRVLACTSRDDVTSETSGVTRAPGRSLASFLKRAPAHVLRLATPDEVHIWMHDQVDQARTTLGPCREAVARAQLPLTVVDAVYQYNMKKLTFYYDSNVRVDFRDLLQTLFAQFHCRIWLEKIPVALAPSAAAETA